VPGHIYVDESKTHGFRFVMALVDDGSVETSRSAMKSLAARGARTFHASHESDRRRRQALRVVAALPVRFWVVEVPLSPHRGRARETGVKRVMSLAVGLGASRVVFDLDESNLSRDRLAAASIIASLDPDTRPTYHHLHAATEPLLWFPDLVAWAWSKDASWRHLMTRLGIDVRVDALP
jgi:hypothetical protein